MPIYSDVCAGPNLTPVGSIPLVFRPTAGVMIAYDESGWNDRAIEQYEIFLEIWKDADPGIPEIDDALERLAGLRESS